TLGASPELLPHLDIVVPGPDSAGLGASGLSRDDRAAGRTHVGSWLLGERRGGSRNDCHHYDPGERRQAPRPRHGPNCTEELGHLVSSRLPRGALSSRLLTHVSAAVLQRPDLFIA